MGRGTGWSGGGGAGRVQVQFGSVGRGWGCGRGAGAVWQCRWAGSEGACAVLPAFRSTAALSASPKSSPLQVTSRSHRSVCPHGHHQTLALQEPGPGPPSSPHGTGEVLNRPQVRRPQLSRDRADSALRVYTRSPTAGAVTVLLRTPGCVRRGNRPPPLSAFRLQ